MKHPAGKDVGSAPELGVRAVHRKTGFYERFGKRLFDICFVVLSAPIVLPFVALMLVMVSLDGAKPLYRQRRIGRNGKEFKLLKIRTMVPNADAVFQDYLAANPDARREWDLTQKLKKDPRITLVGRFLRKTSLDELPQVWNVLVGEMSIVGPRPMMVSQASIYPGNAYFEMRPGITGLWQVTDRNNSSFMARAGFDARYYNSLSLKNDISIICRTVLVVLRGTGY